MKCLGYFNHLNIAKIDMFFKNQAAPYETFEESSVPLAKAVNNLATSLAILLSPSGLLLLIGHYR